MNEIVVNLHMHTRYSDGSGSHADIGRAAIRSGIDAVIVTDHNVLVGGIQGYFQHAGRRVLMMVGEEVHDRTREPQKDHLLVFGVKQDVAPQAGQVEALLRAVQAAGGLAFIAHPIDPAAAAFDEQDISWTNWSVTGFNGIELWNGLSEFKSRLRSRLHGLIYAFLPGLVATGPDPAALAIWDRLLEQRPTVAIGGSDAHALDRRAGPLHRTIFSYEFHFRAINTHVLLNAPFTGDAAADSAAILAAIAAGRCFIGYDLAAPTRGFRFSGHAAEGEVPMGSRARARGGVALQATLPDFAEIRLYRNGACIETTRRAHALTHRAIEPGVYRIEAYRTEWGRKRAWIFSNPIYLV